MAVNSKWVNEALVYYEEGNESRWLDAKGNNVSKFMLRAGTATDSATGLPTRFVDTLVNASTVVNSATAGELLKITTAAAEYDGACMTGKGEAFKCTASKPFYWGAKLKISNATLSEFVVGMCETLTAYMAAAAHTVVAASLEGLFFHKPADVTVLTAYSYQTNVQKASAVAAAVIDTSYHIYEVLWDGATAHFYYDGVLVTTTAVSLPDGDLTPVVHFRTGSGNARTMEIAWMRAIQIN